MMSKLDEFSLIKRYFHKIGSPKSEVKLGIGDDCAVVALQSDLELCVSIDTMVSGVHFPEGASGQVVADRVLSAAVSDLAAMGAAPSHFTMSLTMPDFNRVWLDSFAKSLADQSVKYGLSLIGGDTTRGSLTIAIQVHGFVPKGKALLRSGARPGDLVVVSGSLGDAGAGLRLYGADEVTEVEEFLVRRFCCPTARIKEGLVLRKYASACIDISDGLLADLKHVADASGVLIKVDKYAVPISHSLDMFAGDEAIGYALYSGDDYELAATISSECWDAKMTSEERGLFTVIGCVDKYVDGEALLLYESDKPVDFEPKGYRHFD